MDGGCLLDHLVVVVLSEGDACVGKLSKSGSLGIRGSLVKLCLLRTGKAKRAASLNFSQFGDG